MYGTSFCTCSTDVRAGSGAPHRDAAAQDTLTEQRVKAIAAARDCE